MIACALLLCLRWLLVHASLLLFLLPWSCVPLLFVAAVLVSRRPLGVRALRPACGFPLGFRGVPLRLVRPALIVPRGPRALPAVRLLPVCILPPVRRPVLPLVPPVLRPRLSLLRVVPPLLALLWFPVPLLLPPFASPALASPLAVLLPPLVRPPAPLLLLPLGRLAVAGLQRGGLSPVNAVGTREAAAETKQCGHEEAWEPPLQHEAPDAEEWELRVQLAVAYRWAARHGLAEGVCNHFTIEVVPGRFLVIPYGMQWSEVTAASLLLTSLPPGAPKARKKRHYHASGWTFYESAAAQLKQFVRERRSLHGTSRWKMSACAWKRWCCSCRKCSRKPYKMYPCR